MIWSFAPWRRAAHGPPGEQVVRHRVLGGDPPQPGTRAPAPGITFGVDATLLGAASEKEGAPANYKGGFGFHPLLCHLDETGESLAGLLPPGNAGEEPHGYSRYAISPQAARGPCPRLKSAPSRQFTIRSQPLHGEVTAARSPGVMLGDHGGGGSA